MFRPEQSAQSVRRGKTEEEAYLVESSQVFRLRYDCESSRKFIK